MFDEFTVALTFDLQDLIRWVHIGVNFLEAFKIVVCVDRRADGRNNI